MKLITLSVLAAGLTHSVIAGDKIGGGADVLVCKKPGKIKTYQLLDVLEASKAKRPLDLSQAETIEEKIDLMTARLMEMDPERAIRYREEVLKIHEDLMLQEKGKAPKHNLAVFEKDLMNDIDDSEEVFAPEDCTKYQLVRQKTPLSNFDHTYDFQKGFWEKLDADNRVATLFHEVIYKEFRELGHNNSLSARHLNSFVFSSMIRTTGACDYLDFMKRVGIKQVFLFGRMTVSTESEKSGEIVCNADREIETIRYTSDYHPFTGSNFHFKAHSVVLKNRKLSEAMFDDTLMFDNKPTIMIGKVYSEDNALRFTNVAKSKGGALGFLLYSDLTIQSLSETGYYKGTLSEEAKTAATPWLSCARDYAQSKRWLESSIQTLNAQYKELKTAAANENIAKISSLAQACKDLPFDTEKASRKSRKQMAAKLSWLYSMAFPKRISCEGHGGSLNASIGAVGAGVGFYGMTCKLTDGSTRSYMGSPVKLRMGTIGIKLEAGRYHYDKLNQSYKQTDDIPGFFHEVYGNVYGYRNPKNAKHRHQRVRKKADKLLKEQHIYSPVLQSSERMDNITSTHAIGLDVAVFGEAVGATNITPPLFIPIKRSQDDWSAWLKSLPQGEIVQY